LTKRGDVLTTGDKTRALVEWVFFTSLTFIIGLAGIILPPVYFVATVLLPLPVIMLVLRQDARYGLLALALVGLIMLLPMRNPVAVLVLILHYGLLGILYGLLFKNQVSSGKNIAMGMAGAVALALISVGLVYVLTGDNPLVLSQEDRRVVEQLLEANRSAGAINGMPPEWQDGFAGNMISIFELFIPGQFIVTAAAAAGITYFLARACLSRLNFTLPPAPAFTRLQLPWYSVWGLIAGLGLTLAGDQFSLPLAAKTGKNILFILFYVYLALGLSVLFYFYYKIKMAKFLRITFLLLTAVYLPFSAVILILLGVADPLVNFRRLPAVKE
jgi:uncharacterized protein YybS (DUF2232 family)